MVKKVLRKNEAMLTAEEELVLARELFRADCAARYIRTCQDAERERERARTVGPIPKVRNTPIGPAGPIPPLDTKLLVTSNGPRFYCPSLCLRLTPTLFC